MQKQEKQEVLPIEEEVIEEKLSVCSEPDESMAEQNQQYSDELLPKPAFQIEDDHQHLTVEEKEAFTYIISVRNQKQALFKNRKVQFGLRQTEDIHQVVSQKQQRIDQLGQSNFDSIKAWRSESVAHWQCVVQNIKYLTSHSPPSLFFRQKLNYDCTIQLPLVHNLCLNKWLTLSQIQRILVQFCNAHYSKIQSIDNLVDLRDSYFNLWIYSLLALHQSYASYTNFQALASINAVIERQNQFFSEKRGVETQFQPILKNHLTGWLINVVLLVDVFKQHFLKKYITETLINYLKEEQINDK